MQTWKNTDKSEWENGPWMDEPDKAQWIHAGLDCLIVRGPGGALCGYVGVPESHPGFERDYDEVNVDVHGGLTFADKCQPSEEGDHRGICHTEENAANAVVWWLGFDCAHSGDLCPKYDRLYLDATYKTFAYVKRETERLADQLSEFVA